MMTLVARAAGATALESRTATVTPAAVGTATAATATTADGPLEPRARIAANAGGVARIIFPAGSSTGGARRASFAWQEEGVLFDGRGFRDRFAGSGSHDFVFRVEVLGLEGFFGAVLLVCGLLFF